MIKKLYSKNIVSHQGVIEGVITIKDGKIIGLEKGKPKDDFLNFQDDTIYPGFIDLHIHGWGRGSFALENTPDSIIKMGEDQAKEGVTNFLATTMTDSIEETLKYIETGNQVYGSEIKGANFLGIHLEGPFINKEQKGMQAEEHCVKPNLNLMKEFYECQKDKTMIKLMTMAPELDKNMEVIRFCKEHNIQVSAGHTSASHDVLSLVKDYDELAIKENSCAYEKAKLAVSNILGWQPAEVEGQKFPAVVEVPFYPASLFSGYRAGYTPYQYFKPVSYPGGQKALEDDLKQYFMGLFFDYQINGDLVMIFKIDRYGHIYDLVLESRIENERFKKDIIKTIKRFNKNKTWIPASIHGQPVASEFHYTANFTTTYR